ncbi:hypothetical protein K439DRAFT_1657008, partial [Ramaria rubella]
MAMHGSPHESMGHIMPDSQLRQTCSSRTSSFSSEPLVEKLRCWHDLAHESVQLTAREILSRGRLFGISNCLPLFVHLMSTFTGDLQSVQVTLEDSRIVSYCNLASYAMLLYDYFLTIGQEVELVWPTSWSLGKLLYCITRYFAFVDGAMSCYFHTIAPFTVLPSTCTLLYKFSGALIIWGMVVSELILVFRTWAIWGQSNKVAITLLSLVAILAIPTGFFAYWGLKQVTFGPSPISRLGSCWITTTPSNILFSEYIIVAVFETVILALTMYKGLYHLRQSNSSLVVTLYRDGMLYYIYLICISFVNIIVLTAVHKPGPSLILMQRDLHSIFTARILINLREAAYRDRARRTLSTCTETALNVDEHRQETWSALTSVIIGVESWFRDHTEEGIENIIR